MDDEAAWTFFLAGTVWVVFYTAGLWVLQAWAPRRAVVYALYSAFAGNVGICTFAVAAFAPVFLLPSIGSTAGLILLEYFFVALGYQLWSTWRHFNAQWSAHHEAALARCFDSARSTVAVKSLARSLHIHETLFLPYWNETVVAVVSLVLFVALILGFALYDSFFDFALLAGGIASLSIVTYLMQRSLVPLLLGWKLRQLERLHGFTIRLMDDAGVDRIKAADRRAKRGNKR